MNAKTPKSQIIASWAQVFVAVLMVFVTIRFSSIANSLTDANNRLVMQQRKSQIRPILEITSETNFDRNFDNIVVRLRNIGPGVAKSLRVMVESEGQVKGEIYHHFSSIGRLSMGNSSERQQKAFTLYPTESHDFVNPNEEVEFEFSAFMYFPEEYREMTSWDRMELALKKMFTFYLSYLDIDGNEYLTITKLPPAGGQSGLTIFTPDVGDSLFLDSLKILSSPLSSFQSKTYDNINLRTPVGAFKNLSSTKK
jgi:hypothetical protein